MIGFLRRERRRIDELGRAVRHDAAALAAGRARLADGIRRELGRPKVMLAIFAAGLGYGWLRRPSTAPSPSEADVSAPPTLARLAAVVAAGLRLYEHARRAAALVEPYGAQAQRDASNDTDDTPGAAVDPSEEYPPPAR